MRNYANPLDLQESNEKSNLFSSGKYIKVGRLDNLYNHTKIEDAGENRLSKKRAKKRLNIKNFPKQRKLEHTGIQGISRVIGIPIEWINEVGSDNGSPSVYIECFEDDYHFLTVIPDRLLMEPLVKRDALFRTKLPAELDKNTLEVTLRKLNRVILSTYLVGYRRVVIRNAHEAFGENLISRIKYFCSKKLCGPTFPACPNTEIVVEIGVPSDFKLPKRLRELCKGTVSMHKELQTLVENFNDSKARLAINADDETDRVSHEVVRLCKLAAQNPLLIKHMKIENYRTMMGFRIISKSIERCTDLACYALKELLRLYEVRGEIQFSSGTRKAIIGFDEKALKILKGAIDTLLDLEKPKRYTRADELVEEVDELIASVEHTSIELDSKMETPEEFYCLKRILDSLKRTGEYTKTILEIIENMSIETVVQEPCKLPS